MQKCLAVVVSYLLLLPASFAAPAPATDRYDQLFDGVEAVMNQVEKVCKTDECISLTVDGRQLVSDGRWQKSHNLFVGDTVKNFHTDLNQNLAAVIAALAKILPSEQAKLLKNMPCRTLGCERAVTGKKDFDGGKLILVQSQCGSCDIVYKASLAICALYAIASPIAAAICAAIATGAYANCINKYCAQPVVPPQK